MKTFFYSRFFSAYCNLLVVIFSATLMTHPLQAQEVLQEDLDPKGFYIGLHAAFEVNSTGLTNRFINDVYQGRYLDVVEKNEALKALSAEDLFYYGLSERISFRIPDTARPLFYYGWVEDRSFLELGFTREFFSLYFFGNSGYKGEQLDFGPLSMQFLRYQQFSLGICRTLQGKKGMHYFGSSLGINKGQNHLYADAERAMFYTAPDISYVELDVAMQLRRSDTAYHDMKAVNGYGASAALFYRFDGLRDKVSIAAENIGFIRWNKHSQEYSRDTVYRFDGFYVDDLFDIQGETFDGGTTDSILEEFTLGKKTGSYLRMLPATLRISYTHTFDDDRIRMEAGVVRGLFSQAHTLVYVRPSCRFKLGNCRLDVAPVARYGGYATLNTGLEIGFYVKKSFAMIVGCPYIDAMLTPGQLAGAGGYFSVMKSF